ncbi:MAG: DUF3365 domain-containing protein [Imperialibacter sp.]|uniref:Tll0287-like domain-containing protein n=1 Tax=Imperialibacter sp. TaxID=2038411 RepID=UPI0032ED3555
MRTPIILCLSVCLIAVGCGPMDKGNSEEVKKEMEDRKVKHVLPSQITDKAKERGLAITDAAQKVLLQTLIKKIESEGILGAVEYCNVNAFPLVDSLSKANLATIRRVSNKWRNPKDAPEADEIAIMEAYAYSVEQGQAPREEVFMEDNSTQVIYTRPIMMGAGLCLQCHGTPGKELTQEVEDKIKSLYPDDKATGYELGEWRGIWKVVFEKKELVLEL